MELRLSSKNQAKLERLITQIGENAHNHTGRIAYYATRPYNNILLDDRGYRFLVNAIKTLQTVSQWDEAYAPKQLTDYLIDAYFESQDAPEVVMRLTRELNANCKHIRAYVALSGFEIDPGVELRIGKYVVRVLGSDGLENEIIARFDEHMAAINADERYRENSRALYRGALQRHANLPVLVVDYNGRIEDASDVVQPIAEQVALFMQFCIGMLTDAYFHHTLVVDYRGRFFAHDNAVMPVMTVEFGRMSFVNLHGIPWDCKITKDNFDTLESLGVLALARDFVGGPKPPNSTDALLVRAIRAFADGERSISPLARISSYVTAAEVFFSRNGLATATVTAGFAACNSEEGDDGGFAEQYDLAGYVYKQRSNAVHRGLEPTAAYLARTLSQGVIVRMIGKRFELRNRKEIDKWLDRHLGENIAECPRCGAPLKHAD